MPSFQAAQKRSKPAVEVVETQLVQEAEVMPTTGETTIDETT
jgi:hypothetical protein